MACALHQVGGVAACWVQLGPIVATPSLLQVASKMTQGEAGSYPERLQLRVSTVMPALAASSAVNERYHRLYS